MATLSQWNSAAPSLRKASGSSASKKSTSSQLPPKDIEGGPITPVEQRSVPTSPPRDNAPLDLSVLKGLEVGENVEDEPEDLLGKVVGDDEVVPGEAAHEAMKSLPEDLPDTDDVEETADNAKESASLGKFDDVKDTAEDTVDDAQGAAPTDKVDSAKDATENAVEEAEDAAPSVPDLQVKEVNENRLVLDDDGNKLSEDPEQATHQAEGAVDDIEAEADQQLPPLSTLEGLKCNKSGKIIDTSGKPVGELIEGDPKKLAKLGAQLDDKGQFWDNRGNVIGKAQTIPVEDKDDEPPFAGLEGLIVVKDGWIEDDNENRVGKLVEGDAKKLVGRAVDEDGDILSKHGSVVGRAERYEEPEEQEAEPEKIDLSSLAGLTPNKLGYVIGQQGVPVARVVEGDVKKLAGKRIDQDGQIWNDSGKVIGRVKLIPESERESKPEGPFAGLDGSVVNKEGFVEDDDNNIVGQVTEGDSKKLRGRMVDEDGDIIGKYGDIKGHAEPYEPPEEEEQPEDLSVLEGKERWEPEPEGPSEEELEKQKKAEHDKQLADKMCGIIGQTLDRIRPICQMIVEHLEKADRTPKDELDEEKLVQTVKPLIEEGGRILQECNGAIRALDPDGSIAAHAKARAASRDATPEEYRLADMIKELTETVVKTIDNGRKRIADMPHAKKKLNPLWALLSEPLFQIIAAVGLLLTGVLGLVGRLLEGLGLGPLVHGLLGGLGIDKLLGSLGLSSITDALGLTGKK